VRSELRDSFGRVLNYLRVSVTDRCNLRCIYCMPPEGVEWKSHDSILSFEEIIRLVKIMAALGVRHVKVTGGEPLLRIIQRSSSGKGKPSLIRELKEIEGIEKVTLTTNGLLLEEYLDGAEKYGWQLPDGINISMDALDNERYQKITRLALKNNFTNLSHLCASIKTSSLINRLLEKKVTVKINCVPLRGVNEEEIVPLAELARDKNIIVRFIELMPIGTAVSYQCVPGGEAAERITKKFGALTPADDVKGSGPAAYYSLSGFTGKIGFINAVTHSFCESCNRLRLTSEGFLKLCLSNNSGVNLRELLRGGASDAELSNVITEAAVKKPRSNNFSEQSEGMSKIGG